MNRPKEQIDRYRDLKKMGIIFILLAVGFSSWGYFFSEANPKTFYMNSLVFLAMAIYCLFRRASS